MIRTNMAYLRGSTHLGYFGCIWESSTAAIVNYIMWGLHQ